MIKRKITLDLAMFQAYEDIKCEGHTVICKCHLCWLVDEGIDEKGYTFYVLVNEFGRRYTVSSEKFRRLKLIRVI